MKVEASSFKITDPSFNRTSSFHYHLSLLISRQSISCCVLDLKENKLIHLEESLFPTTKDAEALCGRLKLFITGSAVAGIKFRSVSAGLYSDIYTLVPSALFDEVKKEDILRFNISERTEASMVSSDFMQEIEIYNIYESAAAIEKLLKETFEKITKVHFITPLVETLIIENKFKTGIKIYLNFLNAGITGFEVIIIKNGQLLLCNTFTFHSKEDVVYYFLFTLEQLGINPETAAVTLLGNIPQTDETVTLINNYIRSVEFGHRPGSFRCPSFFDEVPPHFYYSLFSQYLYAV